MLSCALPNIPDVLLRSPDSGEVLSGSEINGLSTFESSYLDYSFVFDSVFMFAWDILFDGVFSNWSLS